MKGRREGGKTDRWKEEREIGRKQRERIKGRMEERKIEREERKRGRKNKIKIK